MNGERLVRKRNRKREREICDRKGSSRTPFPNQDYKIRKYIFLFIYIYIFIYRERE